MVLFPPVALVARRGRWFFRAHWPDPNGGQRRDRGGRVFLDAVHRVLSVAQILHVRHEYENPLSRRVQTIRCAVSSGASVRRLKTSLVATRFIENRPVRAGATALAGRIAASTAASRAEAPVPLGSPVRDRCSRSRSVDLVENVRPKPVRHLR